MPHLLGSAYILGASPEQLRKIYDTESKELEEWKDSPAEISDGDWRDFLGKRRYQRAYLDFFEDELALKFGYDSKRVMEEYLFCGEKPLINGIIEGCTFLAPLGFTAANTFLSGSPFNTHWLCV